MIRRTRVTITYRLHTLVFLYDIGVFLKCSDDCMCELQFLSFIFLRCEWHKPFY